MRRDASSSGSNGDEEFRWQRIWQLKFPNKVKMFIWRLAHNSLPVRRNLIVRGVKTGTICPICSRLDEDCGHLFFKCKRAKECWHALNLEHIRTGLECCTSGHKTVMKILKLERQQQTKVFIWLWRWWSARNKANAGGRMAYRSMWKFNAN
jgi:hypothetical protein